MRLLIVFCFALLAQVKSQARDGSAAASRARHLSEARIFDLPKAAPTARIIKLSTLLRKGKRSGGDEDLLRDAAGPFDNFDAFDLDTLEPSSAEVKPSRKHHKTDRKSKGERTEDIGNFFPESRELIRS